jgi:hypothetical protein
VATELVYEIARFDVRTDAEVLTERARVLSRDSALWRCVDGGPETRCAASDVTAVIATDPLLSEIRANEVTRIKAEPAALCELPFGLRVPGDGCDYDESLWSEAMIQEHLDSIAGTETRGVYRVLYVNDARWGAFTTAEGERLLPDDGDDEALPVLNPVWGELSFCENSPDRTVIGPVTPGVVVSAVVIGEDSSENEIVLVRSAADEAAATFVDWLLEGTLVSRYSSCNPFIDVMMAQLFVEASIKGRDGELIAGSCLVAGKQIDEDQSMCSYDTSEWHLSVDLEPAVVDDVLDALIRNGPQFAEVVTAAETPSRGQAALGGEH